MNRAIIAGVFLAVIALGFFTAYHSGYKSGKADEKLDQAHKLEKAEQDRTDALNKYAEARAENERLHQQKQKTIYVTKDATGCADTRVPGPILNSLPGGAEY